MDISEKVDEAQENELIDYSIVKEEYELDETSSPVVPIERISGDFPVDSKEFVTFEIIEVEPIKDSKCLFCETRFKNSSHMKKHMSKHSNIRNFECSHCSKAFKEMRVLKIHLRTHFKQQSVKCDICNKTIKDSWGLKLHKRRQHTKISLEICQTCGKVLSSKRSLTDHIRRIHERRALLNGLPQGSLAVRPTYKDRKQNGFFAVTYAKIRKDEEEFFNLTRMSTTSFDMLLNFVKSKLQKYSMKKSILPAEKLLLTLMFLTHGHTIAYMSVSFKIHKETVRRIIQSTSEAIWKSLLPVYIPVPREAAWKEISQNFWIKWGMPNCLGSIDGKHIRIKAPTNSGSAKKNLSAVLLAACNADYAFTMVDIGDPSTSDGEIFSSSIFGTQFTRANLNIPDDTELPGSNVKFPHYFVADAPFPLRENLMRPFSDRPLPEDQQNFNGRLSRAHITIENAFGILASRFRILGRPIAMDPKNVHKIVSATVVLHNFLKLNNELYAPENYGDRIENGEIIQGQWRLDEESLQSVEKLGSNNSTEEVFKLRDVLKNYLQEN